MPAAAVTRPFLAAIAFGAGAVCGAPAAQAQDAAAQGAPEHHAEPDNGTDPTRVRRSLTVDFEHLELRQGFTSDTLEAVWSEPLGSHTALNATVSLPSVDVAGDTSFGFGDLELQLTHIPVVTRKYGIVLKGEVAFNTASRPELGTGNTVLEATAIYARFLKGGSILAPSLEYDYGIERDAGRSRVHQATLDLYYVPRLKNRAYYMTVDPFVNANFTSDEVSGGLLVTLGRVIGPALGGTLQAYVKPGVYVGSNRGANWGVEAGFKLLGF